jgi:hypothetical protein
MSWPCLALPSFGYLSFPREIFLDSTPDEGGSNFQPLLESANPPTPWAFVDDLSLILLILLIHRCWLPWPVGHEQKVRF